MPNQLSAVAAIPGTQTSQVLFNGPSRLSAYAFTVVQRKRCGNNGVPGDTVFPADEFHLAKHPGIDVATARGVDLGNLYEVLGQEDQEAQRLTVRIQDAIKLPSMNRLKNEKRRQLCSGFQSNRCSSSSSCLDCKIVPSESLKDAENKTVVKERGVTWKHKLEDTNDAAVPVAAAAKQDNVWGHSYARGTEVGASNAVGQIRGAIRHR